MDNLTATVLIVALLALVVIGFFIGSSSFAGWWDVVKVGFAPEFVEWVEEQRAKAA